MDVGAPIWGVDVGRHGDDPSTFALPTVAFLRKPASMAAALADSSLALTRQQGQGGHGRAGRASACASHVSSLRCYKLDTRLTADPHRASAA
jgi:hypothetical protein